MLLQQGFATLLHMLLSGCVGTYLLAAGHPAADGRHQDGAEQDLSWMVDEQGDRDERQMLVALKHNL